MLATSKTDHTIINPATGHRITYLQMAVRRHVNWTDINGDGIPDVIDPSIFSQEKHHDHRVHERCTQRL